MMMMTTVMMMMTTMTTTMMMTRSRRMRCRTDGWEGELVGQWVGGWMDPLEL